VAAPRRVWRLAPVLLVLALIAAWLLWPAAKPAPAPVAEAPLVPMERQPEPARPRRDVPADTAKLLANLGAPTVEKIQRAIDHFKEMNVYPPWSRAHDLGSKYLVDWQKPAASELPMDESPNAETMYTFDADRAHVMHGEAITSWIEVWRVNDKSRRVPITVHAAYVNATSGPSTAHLLPLSYHDDGLDGDQVAGDLRYTNRFVPSAQGVLKSAQQVHLLADVESGGQRRQMMREFTYAPRKVLEVLNVTETIKDGSLAVTLQVNVIEKGIYTLLANLMAPDGTPIAWAEKSSPLEPGHRAVELTFFGRAIVEKALNGPYQIRDVRGYLNFFNGEEMPVWFHEPRAFPTRPYLAKNFSGAEWDGPEKREQLHTLEDTLKKTQSGELGGSGPSKHIHVGEDGVAREVPPGTAP
jgi:hypothetical protein